MAAIIHGKSLKQSKCKKLGVNKYVLRLPFFGSKSKCIWTVDAILNKIVINFNFEQGLL